MIHARRSVTIHRDRDAVHRYWRDLDRLPTFVIHLDSVRVEDDLHSHWDAHAPAGRHVEWNMPLMEAPKGYDIFLNEEDGCEKVVLRA